MRSYNLSERVSAVLISPVAKVAKGQEIEGMSASSLPELAGWILGDQLLVRLQTQLHKLIWGAEIRGV